MSRILTHAVGPCRPHRRARERLLPRGVARACFAWIVLAAALVMAPAALLAQVTCDVAGLPGQDEATLDLRIDSPIDGSTISSGGSCDVVIDVTGTYSVVHPRYDFYLVFDASHSTAHDSGADVNRNGVFGEPADDIYQAEISAAEAFLATADPQTLPRAAVIDFAGSPIVQHPLDANLAAEQQTLEAMRAN